MKRICVFCGASPGTGQVLGPWVARVATAWPGTVDSRSASMRRRVSCEPAEADDAETSCRGRGDRPDLDGGAPTSAAILPACARRPRARTGPCRRARGCAAPTRGYAAYSRVARSRSPPPAGRTDKLHLSIAFYEVPPGVDAQGAAASLAEDVRVASAEIEVKEDFAEPL